MTARFSVHPLAAAGLFLVFCVMPTARAAAFFSATLAHEAAHVFAGAMFGARVKKITLVPFGISISMSAPRSYSEEIFVAAAGPVMNFTVCAVIIFGKLAAPCADLLLFSLTFGALNLLPVRSLDGGAVLTAALSLMIGRDAAERVVDITGAAGIFFLWLIGVYIFFYGAENFTLVAFSSCLFVYAVMKNGKKQNNS